MPDDKQKKNEVPLRESVVPCTSNQNQPGRGTFDSIRSGGEVSNTRPAPSNPNTPPGRGREKNSESG